MNQKVLQLVALTLNLYQTTKFKKQVKTMRPSDGYINPEYCDWKVICSWQMICLSVTVFPLVLFFKLLLLPFSFWIDFILKMRQTWKQGFLAHSKHKVLRVSYCDHLLSVRPLSVRPFSVCRPFTFLCLHSSIYKYQLISTQLGQNIYDHTISHELTSGCNRTRTSGVICPWIKKECYI